MSVHERLTELLPCDYGSVPESEQDLAKYIQDAVAKAQELVDSVPPASTDPASTGSSKATGAASSGDQVKEVDAESDAPVNEEMRKAWGKPMKLSTKENPHSMAVYKMAAKDRRGAWFARRSVHEGLGFARWKRGLDMEFEDSLKMPGKPGNGNVRGIGGEKRIVTKEITNVGKVEVFHLTAQFPGPSSPRDFVELLISSTTHPSDKDAPRQYLLISRPVTHPDMPEQSGYVRGQYESIEFIREIPVRKTKIMSTTSLPATVKDTKKADPDEPSDKLERSATDSQMLNTKTGKISAEDAEAMLEARKAHGESDPTEAGAGKKAKDSDTDSGVAMAVDENDELAPNPVEWIMITRSDPGGSVPKFMVERGTPSAIVSDAGKFLQWATQRTMPADGDDEADKRVAPQHVENKDDPTAKDIPAAESTQSITETAVGAAGAVLGVASSLAAAAARHASNLTRTATVVSNTSDSSSSDSFVSADSITSSARAEANRDGISELPPKSFENKYDQQEYDLSRKLSIQKMKLNQKVDETRERHGEDEERMKRACEKRDKKTAEADKWYEKEMGKVKQRREKAEQKKRDSVSKKDLYEKIDTLTKENEELKKQLETMQIAAK